MNQGYRFIAVLAPTAFVVSLLVLREFTGTAVAAGTAGILVHWWLTRSDNDDGELADASYFFGFVLTLVFLTVGLWALSGESTAAAATGGASLMRFLGDLAAGLLLTIVGLAVRQVRTLSTATRATTVAAAAGHTQADLTSALAELVAVLRARPEAQVAHELDQARSRARESVDRFDQSVAGAARRMADNIERLEAAVIDATNSMQRAGTHLGDSLAEAMQRAEAELSHTLAAIERQRAAADAALDTAQNAATQLRSRAEEQLKAHTTMWQVNLEQARAALEQTHRALDDEYRRGVAAFADTGAAFRQLAESTVARVQAMPDPAERLTGLWDGVRDLESALTDAITRAADELTTLRDRAEQLGAGLTRLAGSTDEAAHAVTSGGTRMGDALLREIQQMNRIIEEYTALLEKTTRTLARR